MSLSVQPVPERLHPWTTPVLLPGVWVEERRAVHPGALIGRRDCYQVSYMVGGRLAVVTGEGARPARAGDVLVVHGEGTGWVQASVKQPPTLLTMVFTSDALEERYRPLLRQIGAPECPPVRVLPGLEPYSSDVALCMRRVAYEQTHWQTASELKVQSCMEALVVSLLRMQEKRYAVTQEGDHRAVVVANYLRANYYKPISLEDVASLLHVGARQCSNLLRRWFQTSFMDLLTHVRVEEAKVLLTTTDKTVTFIAMEVGYEDASHFIRVFKQATGLTPGQFRTSTRNSEFDK